MGLLYQFEQACIRLRHSPWLRRAEPLWNGLRPAYDAVMRGVAGSKGLVRNFNGTDAIRILPEFRNLHESYEPEVWKVVMAQIGPGSKVIDVGAHAGLYAMAFGHRVGANGRVLAVEPDPANLVFLRRHVELNGLGGIVEILAGGLSDSEGEARLATGDMQSHVVSGDGAGPSVRLTTLDAATRGEHWDLMLIDVEGFEEKVLKGGKKWLSDPACRPSMIVVEVHPYAWKEIGTTSASMLDELGQHGYRIEWMDGKPVTEISDYGHIVARPL